MAVEYTERYGERTRYFDRTLMMRLEAVLKNCYYSKRTAIMSVQRANIRPRPAKRWKPESARAAGPLRCSHRFLTKYVHEVNSDCNTSQKKPHKKDNLHHQGVEPEDGQLKNSNNAQLSTYPDLLLGRHCTNNQY